MKTVGTAVFGDEEGCRQLRQVALGVFRLTPDLLVERLRACTARSWCFGACTARSWCFVGGDESRGQAARLQGEIPGLRHYLL